MPRLIGIDIPGRKRLIISLTYIHGVGPKVAEDICSKMKLDPNVKAETLTSDQLAQLNGMLQKDFILEGDLRRQKQGDIRRLQSIRCYRGLRHQMGLPVRGQGTQTNARTRKGRKKTVAGKKK
jgi:small subunit ribosomal protein S13